MSCYLMQVYTSHHSDRQCTSRVSVKNTWHGYFKFNRAALSCMELRWHQFGALQSFSHHFLCVCHVMPSQLNISHQVMHQSLASQLVSPSHDWVSASEPRSSHTWHRAPRGNVRDEPEPRQHTSVHEKKTEQPGSFQTGGRPITEPNDKR